MSDGRLRSMVPMFGGGKSYVDTLDRILRYTAAHEPSHDDLIDWHREQFANVQSKESIERRLAYIEDLEFTRRTPDGWELDEAGRRYLSDQDREQLFDMMAERNVGFQGLLFELVDRPMTTDEINEFLLETNATLDWNPSNTDMAKQRINWLRSFGLIERRGEQFTATDLGEQYITEIQSIRSVWQQTEEPGSSVAEYATAGTTRGLDPEFRAVVLARYNTVCPVSTVDHEVLLDVAHILPWSDHPEHRADFGNVLPLSRTHHAAFDAELFTIDGDYRLHVDPAFETDSPHLRQTLTNQAGSRISALAEGKADASYLETRNESLAWF